MHTVNLHLLSRDTSILTEQRADGRLTVVIESDHGDARIAITCASKIGDPFVGPIAFADQLEAAAKRLRRLAAPVDPGDHFVRPEAVAS